MSWGTPITAPSNTAPTPIKLNDGSLDWSPVIEAAAYHPDTFLSDDGHPLHSAWLAERDRRLAAWEAAKTTLEAAKESEMQLRRAAQSFAFGPAAKPGMNNQPLNGGYVLKFGKKVNTNIVASNDLIDAAEDKAAKIGNGRGQFLFERIIVWKPDFSLSEYKKLDASDPTEREVKNLIDELIETKEGAGSLEIKAPKATLS